MSSRHREQIPSWLIIAAIFALLLALAPEGNAGQAPPAEAKIGSSQ